MSLRQSRSVRDVIIDWFSLVSTLSRSVECVMALAVLQVAYARVRTCAVELFWTLRVRVRDAQTGFSADGDFQKGCCVTRSKRLVEEAVFFRMCS